MALIKPKSMQKARPLGQRFLPLSLPAESESGSAAQDRATLCQTQRAPSRSAVDVEDDATDRSHHRLNLDSDELGL